MKPEAINWIASYPKSGNTWVRLFLNAYTLGELDINCNSGVTLFDTQPYLVNVVSPHHQLDYETSYYLRPAILLHLMVSRRYTPTMVKTHWANVTIGGVTAIPRPLTQSAVYLVRDPRDVCVSFSRHLGKSIDNTIVELSNKENVLVDPEIRMGTWLTSWSNHVETWDRDFVTTIRYEDLKRDPEQGFAEILKTFKIKRNVQKIRKAIRLTNIERLKSQEKKSGFIEIGKQEKFFGQGSGWKDELTDKQANRIVEDHKDMMKKYGYLDNKVLRRVV